MNFCGTIPGPDSQHDVLDHAVVHIPLHIDTREGS